jgi:hypothetical protein
MLNRLGTALLWAFLLALPVWAGGAVDEQVSSASTPLSEKYPERVSVFLASLNLAQPGLELARNALDAGDEQRALEEVLNYFREKPFPNHLRPSLPPARKDIVELAEDATRDIFTIQSRTYTQPRLESGGLDWDDLGPNNDKEWGWMMNRHKHFPFLITAYRYNGKSIYLETANDHLIDWVVTHPVPDRLSFSTSWRALEAARRVTGAWLALYAYAKSEPQLTDEGLFMLLSSIPEHARLLREHHSFWGGNHIVTEKMAIAVCALIWPEFKSSPEWLNYALVVLQDQLLKQTYPDGSYKELANHYQKIVAQNFLKVIYLLGKEADIPFAKDFIQRVELMWNYFAYVSRPSGFGPLNNDSTLEDNFHHLEDAVRFYDRSDWKHIITHGEEGEAPDISTTKYFPWAGHAIMRNNWSADAHWAFFDVGPNGSAHQHFDRLHLSVSWGQEDILVDTGRYIYVPGPFRDYFRSGKGHNVVRVNGKDSLLPPNTVNQPMPIHQKRGESFHLFQSSVRFASQTLSGGKAVHDRAVVYVNDIGWLVIDQLLGFGPNKYETNWNFHPDCLVTQDGLALDIRTISGRHASLKLISRSEGEWKLVRGQTEPEVLGWYSWAYNERRPSSHARFVTYTNQPQINVWWIAPEGMPTPTLEGELRRGGIVSLETSQGELEIRIGANRNVQVTELKLI